MDPNTSDMSLAEMDYKGAFSKGELLPQAAVSGSAWKGDSSGRAPGLGAYLPMSQSGSSVGEHLPGFHSRAAKIEVGKICNCPSIYKVHRSLGALVIGIVAPWESTGLGRKRSFPVQF